MSLSLNMSILSIISDQQLVKAHQPSFIKSKEKPKNISFSFLGDLRFNIIINSNYKNRASLKLGGEIIIKIGSNCCTGCPLLGGALKIRINNVSYEGAANLNLSPKEAGNLSNFFSIKDNQMTDLKIFDILFCFVYLTRTKQ